MFKDTIKATGQLNIQLIGPDGQLKDERKVKNLVVDTGKDYIAARMKNDAGTTAIMSHMAVGTNALNAADTTQTTLGAEVSLSRTSLDVAGGTVTNNEVQYTATFAPGIGSGAIAEAGLFNSVTSGDMLARTVFAVVNKGVDDSLAITWTITINY